MTTLPLEALLALGREILTLGFIVFLRVGAAMALLPAFGDRMVPARVRLGLTLGLTVIVAPTVAAALPNLGATVGLGRIVATEVVAGLALGATLRLFVMALQMAGSIAAQSVSLSQIFGGQAMDAQPAIGHVMGLAGLALAAMSGLHVKVVALFLVSYDLLPPGVFPAPGDLMDWGVARVAHAFALAFGLAAPFVIASLVYNLALGVINRAMPQLMVAFVGAPAITLAGLVLLMLSMPLILPVWLGAMDVFLAAPFGVR